MSTTTHGFTVGQLVMVGSGKKLWTIESFWTGHSDGEELASLSPVDGYGGTTVAVGRLRTVSA